MEFYNKLSDGKKSALIGGLLTVVLFSILFYVADKRKQKLESDFVWTEAVIIDIKLNVPKGTTTTKHIFRFEYTHNGSKYEKVRQVYRPELLNVGQIFIIKVHRVDPELIGFELEGT